MPRIIYLLPTFGAIQGGHKVILRHVEALRELGFDAYCGQGGKHNPPAWLDYSVPFLKSPAIQEDDVVVIPDDAQPTLKTMAATDRRVVILAQNPFYFALRGFEGVDAFAADRLPTFVSVSPALKRTIERVYPAAQVEVVPCFADERLFKPAEGKTFSVVFAPRKRPLEAKMIEAFFRKLHPRHADLEWIPMEAVREPQVAALMGKASLFLSLSRMESVGMTPLEAMASGCVCAGFLGLGGAEFAKPDNGFWVADDDCEAAADALAEAADLVRAGSARTTAVLAAGERTAEAWSYRRFRERLEAFWMEVAPQARLR